jgi:hypothetical protein
MDSKTLLRATQDAVRNAASIADTTPGYEAIAEGFKSLLKIVRYCNTYDVENQHYCPECGRKGISFDAASKAAANLTKVVNDTVRLMEFHKGNADSRTETIGGMEDLVKKLTSDQLATVLKWMDDNAIEPLQ